MPHTGIAHANSYLPRLTSHRIKESQNSLGWKVTLGPSGPTSAQTGTSRVGCPKSTLQGGVADVLSCADSRTAQSFSLGSCSPSERQLVTPGSQVVHVSSVLGVLDQAGCASCCSQGLNSSEQNSSRSCLKLLYQNVLLQSHTEFRK